MRVQFQQSSRFDPVAIKSFLYGKITNKELLNMPPGENGEFIEAIVEIIESDDSFIDVETVEPVFLSNGNGPVMPMSNYRLCSNGEVMYLTEELHLNGKRTLIPWKWTYNIPKWFVDSSDKVVPIVKIVLLGGYFDKGCFFWRVPKDVVKMIAKEMYEGRWDPIWYFRKLSNNKKFKYG